MKNILKKYKEIIIAIVIILVIIIFQIAKLINFNTSKRISNVDSTKIEYDTENEAEVNLSEDILKIEKEYSMKNGDRFVKIGNTIVYVDFDNDIYLVNLENKSSQILCTLEDGVQHIYFDGEYVYCMPYYYRGKGIYKIDLSGNIEKIYNGASLQLWLTDKEIYFVDQIGFDDINQIPQGNLCKMDKNGNNKQLIIENIRNKFTLYNNKFYFIDNNTKGVFCSNIDGTEKTELAQGRNSISDVTDTYVSFFDFNDGQKHKVVYLDNKEVIDLGRFGNSVSYNGKTYVYTQKVKSIDEIPEGYTMYELKDKDITEVFETDDILPSLYYVYENYAYIMEGNEFYRRNLTDGSKEKIDIGYSYFIGSKAYSFNTSDGALTEINIYDLKQNTKEKISM